MKKIYVNPEVLFVQMSGHDIVTTSPNSMEVHMDSEYYLDGNGVNQDF